MKTLIAKKDLYYNGNYTKGAEFRAAEQHAKTLILAGLATEKVAAMSAENSPDIVKQPARRYRRRDMRAEDE